MKAQNKFWMTVCFLAFFAVAKAENHFHFMVFGGFNTSRLITDFNHQDVVIEQAKQSYNFGAAIRFEFAKVFYLQSEIYLTRKGGLENVFRPDSLSQRADVQSVDIPLMLGLRLFDSDRFAFRLYGGPVISFLQDKKVNIVENGQMQPWSSIEEMANVYSLQFGAGLDITKRITFDVRYEYAFSPMFKFSDLKTSYKILYFTLGLKVF